MNKNRQLLKNVVTPISPTLFVLFHISLQAAVSNTRGSPLNSAITFYQFWQQHQQYEEWIQFFRKNEVQSHLRAE
jgi:hypothetical protein